VGYHDTPRWYARYTPFLESFSWAAEQLSVRDDRITSGDHGDAQSCGSVLPPHFDRQCRSDQCPSGKANDLITDDKWLDER
jgi:hypothetical protein